MKKVCHLFSGVAALALSTSAFASGIRFDAVILENGKEIARPSVSVEFGKEAVVEVSGHIKFVAIAQPPKGQYSEIQAKIYYFDGKDWVLSWSPSMNANIHSTPSFQHDLKDGRHRVEIMPRNAEKKVAE